MCDVILYLINRDYALSLSTQPIVFAYILMDTMTKSDHYLCVPGKYATLKIHQQIQVLWMTKTLDVIKIQFD